MEVDKSKRFEKTEVAARALMDKRERNQPPLYWAGREDAGHSQTRLWVCINRFRREDSTPRQGKGLAMVMFHANGLHKEVRRRFLAYFQP